MKYSSEPAGSAKYQLLPYWGHTPLSLHININSRPAEFAPSSLSPRAEARILKVGAGRLVASAASSAGLANQSPLKGSCVDYWCDSQQRVRYG